MLRKPMRRILVLCLVLSAVAVMLLRMESAGQQSGEAQPFRITMEPVALSKPLKIKMTIRNVSQRSQKLWVYINDCTHQWWQTSDPAIIADEIRATTKVCRVDCSHHIALRPGETFTQTITPWIAGKTRQGKRTLRFLYLQPSLEPISETTAPNKPYVPRKFWSDPLTLTVGKERLTL